MSKATGYGYALYELAKEEGLEKEIDMELAEVVKVFENNHDFLTLLTNPRIPASERIRILDEVFGEMIHSYLKSLLKILTEKRDISLTFFCFKEYRDKYYKDNNILQVTAMSAVALNDDQKQKIVSKLGKSMDRAIVLENKVDESCIGGIRLEYPGHMIDASIKNRFKKLQHDLKNADYSQAEV